MRYVRRQGVTGGLYPQAKEGFTLKQRKPRQGVGNSISGKTQQLELNPAQDQVVGDNTPSPFSEQDVLAHPSSARP